MSVVSLRQLSKNYGKIQALKSVSFDVPQGSVYGILGPNGSGKTTLLSILMSILKPASGSYTLFDEEPHDAHRRRMGTLLETPNFYHYLSAIQNLKISAAIKGQPGTDIEKVLETVNLLQRKNSAFSTYSLGMKQRLAIASALLGNPEVLIFDEPTNGLDPVGIAEIRSLIKGLARQGKTIIMASHLLDEVEKVCTHVAILKQGNLITSGPVDDIFVTHDWVQVAAANMEALREKARGMAGLQDMAENEGYLELGFAAGTSKLADINRYFFENGIVLSHLQPKKKSLENKFFELTNGK